MKIKPEENQKIPFVGGFVTIYVYDVIFCTRTNSFEIIFTAQIGASASLECEREGNELIKRLGFLKDVNDHKYKSRTFKKFEEQDNEEVDF